MYFFSIPRVLHVRLIAYDTQQVSLFASLGYSDKTKICVLFLFLFGLRNRDRITKLTGVLLRGNSCVVNYSQVILKMRHYAYV